MNMLAMLGDCARRCAYPTPTTLASDTNATRLTSFLNTTHRQLLGLPGMESLRNDTITFASVAGQSLYGLPANITRIEGISDRTSTRMLRLRSLRDLRVHDPGLTSSGTPDSYVPRGLQQVSVQPSAATGLWVVSSSASDTTQSIKVETVRTGGLSFSGAVTVTGTTRVQVGTLTDHIEVVKFYSDLVAVGDLSLYTAAAAGTLLAQIPIGKLYARYLGIQLSPTPSGAITYYVDYVRTIPEMVNPTDEPLLPDDFHWLLVEGALMKEWTKRDDDRRVAAEREWLKGLAALKYFVRTLADDLSVSGQDREPRPRSRFGSQYPAGSGY
jgi:hypothetical protein